MNHSHTIVCLPSYNWVLFRSDTLQGLGKGRASTEDVNMGRGHIVGLESHRAAVFQGFWSKAGRELVSTSAASRLYGF